MTKTALAILLLQGYSPNIATLYKQGFDVDKRGHTVFLRKGTEVYLYDDKSDKPLHFKKEDDTAAGLSFH